MATKLGRFLLEKGKITEEQLEKAFRAQLVFGGRLGTNLIELGYIGERVLGEALAEITEVPYATFEHLQDIPATVIHLIPASLAERYRVVPIRHEEKILHLAMIDPKDVLVLDEVSFLTGLRIQPWVAPEIRILEALDRYYSVPRKRRFITLTGELNLVRDQEGPGPREEPAEKKEVDGAATQEVPAEEIGLDGKPIHELAEPHLRGKPAPPPAGTPGRSRFEELPKSLEAWRWEEPDRDRQGLPAEAERKTTAAARRRSRGVSLEEATDRLAGAETREDVAEAILSYASAIFRRVGLFILQKNQVLAWRWMGNGAPADSFRGVAIPLDAPSLFSPFRTLKSYYLGPVAPLPATLDLFSRLKAPLPRAALLLPIPIHGKVAVLLYGDNECSGLEGIDLPSLQLIVRKASVALEVLILKNKIRTV